MAQAMGWNREDLEAPQAVASSPGGMLHPVNLHYSQQHNYHQTSASSHTGEGEQQDWQAFYPAPPSPVKAPSSAAVPVEARQAAGSGARILGLRRTTFFLSVSNVLLAIGLIVLGVVQNHVLRDSGGPSTGLDTQVPCSSSPSTSAAAASPTPTASTETGKICFATDRSITDAVSLGEVRTECPLSDAAANYTVPGTKLKFRRVCETDYPSGDMGKFPVISMLDCVHLCAQLNLYPASAEGRCLGVSWVYADGPQGTGLSFCYPKSSMKQSQSRAATESAILIAE